MKTVIASVFSMFFVLSLLAQKPVDTLLLLPQVSVADSNPVLRESGRNWTRSDTFLMQISSMSSLGELLTVAQLGFVKSYGPAGISTSAFRGGSASQTAVLWNGVNIQSPMLGQTDLSLFPTILTDEVLISKRGPATAGIQGALGGAIKLKTKFAEDGFGLNLENGIGSFGAYSNAGKVNFGKKSFKGTARVYHQRAQNDFAYTNLHGHPEILEHARIMQWGVVQDLRINTGKNAILEGHFWRQFSQRQIPPNKLQLKSVAEQEDDSWRNVLQWRKWTDKHAFSVLAGFITDKVNYSDSLALISSASKSHMLDIKARHHYYPAFGQLRIEVAYQYISATTNNYDFVPTRNSWTANTIFRKDLAGQKLTAEISLTTSIVDRVVQPVLPGLQLDWHLNEQITFNLAALRNFRLPTFNDLFWVPGGNPDLLPEKSWNFESGFRVDVPLQKTGRHWEATIQAFSRTVDNWILWQPAGNNWQPFNARKVWSRGLEIESSLNKRYKKAFWMLKCRYQFVRSTNQEAGSADQEIIGKQLIYQPTHLGGITGYGGFEKFTAYYTHRWTGNLFTTTDNSRELNGYFLGDLSLKRVFEFETVSISLTLTVNNLWNKSYEVVAFYPMPGRNYELKLSTNI